jgi:hypothetical protein
MFYASGRDEVNDAKHSLGMGVYKELSDKVI